MLEAMKRYGMIVADNGSDWYVSGAPDPRWSNDQLHTLGRRHRLELRGGRHLVTASLGRGTPACPNAK